MRVKNVMETRNLSFAYHDQIQALSDVTMEITSGKKHVVLGPNGAGKSTLFFQLNGVLKPNHGSVLFKGSKVSYRSKELTSLREQVAVVLQDPDDQILSVTVEEDVAFGPMNLGLDDQEVTNRVEEALFIVGMESLRERPVQHLSFGQRKRVSLAGALAMRPEVLIMDEPTAGFDPQMVQWFLELANDLNRGGMTIIISTHDVSIAYEWADVLHVLCEGRLKFSGQPEEFFSNDDMVREYGLVTPYLYEMNRYHHMKTGKPETPFPKSILDATLKLFPNGNDNGNVATLFVRPVEINCKSLKLPASFIDRGRIGAQGINAKRSAKQFGVRVDFLHRGMESCLKEIIDGRDAILLLEQSMVDDFRYTVSSIEENYGLNIPYVILKNY
jgi:cobalt/nickel transport system ATP-binding protein